MCLWPAYFCSSPKGFSNKADGMRLFPRFAFICVLPLVVALLPTVLGDYYVGLVIKIMIYALFALSLQLLTGGAGLVSLGHAAFFGIAAYASVLLSPQSGAANLFLLAPCALAGALLYALLTGALALRTRGVYFIMVTLAFAQMAYYVFHDGGFSGGSDGIYIYFRPEFRLRSEEHTYELQSLMRISYAVFCMNKTI